MPTIVVCAVSYAICKQSQCRVRKQLACLKIGKWVSLCNIIPGSADEDAEEDVEDDEDVELSELVEVCWAAGVLDDLEVAVGFSAESTDVFLRTVSLGLAIRAESVKAVHIGLDPLSTLVTNCV